MNPLYQLMQSYRHLRGPQLNQGWTNVDPGMVRGSGLDNPAAGDLMEMRPDEQPPPSYIQGGPPQQHLSALARLMNFG